MVEEKIEKVENQIEEIEKQQKEAKSDEEKQQLREEKKQLRKEKEQLREKELLLMRRQQPEQGAPCCDVCVWGCHCTPPCGCCTFLLPIGVALSLCVSCCIQ